MQKLLITTVAEDFEVAGNGIFLGPIIESASYPNLPGELEAIVVAYGYCGLADRPWFTLKVRGPDGLEIQFEGDAEDAVQLQPLLDADIQNFLGTWPILLTFERPG